MAADCLDVSLPFTLKRKKNALEDSNSDNNLDDINDSSISLPSLSMNNSIILDEPNKFLRLTPMVRTVYLSYLQKCLLSNYVTCCEKSKDEKIPNIEVKKCADQLELSAVHSALEASLYRQNMLRMIADVKSHTDKKKVYKKLVICLESPKEKIDIAVQTDDTQKDLHAMNNLHGVHITSNCDEALQTALPIVISSSFYGYKDIAKDLSNETNTQTLYKEETVKSEFNDASQKTNSENNSQIMNDVDIIKNEDEDSQDSLLQHMEDMFCESDDSSDLTKLIEKHTTITKPNVNKEISEMYLNANTVAGSNCGALQNNNVSNSDVTRVKSGNKISFSRYKEMRNREANESKKIYDNVDKQRQKIGAVWFVERVHQESNLKVKMADLSTKDYRKYGKVKEMFRDLFGEEEGEEMMPESPVRIEDHLPACKERIAPWIVKYLMPFYKKKKIKNRQLFKEVAKHIADVLIIKNTFPEKKCVQRYIDDYFKNKTYIKTKQDIYL